MPVHIVFITPHTAVLAGFAHGNDQANIDQTISALLTSGIGVNGISSGNDLSMHPGTVETTKCGGA
jgi:hypothetical protein